MSLGSQSKASTLPLPLRHGTIGGFMDNDHRQVDFSEILWGILAIVGCLGMIAFEALLFRISVGKW
jgi:hypothetical protein